MPSIVSSGRPMLASSLRQASMAFSMPAHRRPLVSAPSAALDSSEADAQALLPKRSRIAAVREQLRQDARTLDDFLGLPTENSGKGGTGATDAKSAGSCSSASPAASEASREEEMHRSVLGQLKPDYVKADGSFKRLRRDSRRSLKPATSL